MGTKISAPVCEGTDLNEVIECYDDSVNREYRGINFKRRENVRNLLGESLAAVEERIDAAIEDQANYDIEAPVGDDKKVYTKIPYVSDKDQAGAEATQVLRGVEEDLINFSSHTDVSDMLTRYSEGYALYRVACGDSYGDSLCAALHEKHAHIDDLIAGMSDNNLQLKKVTQYLRFSPFAHYTVAKNRSSLGAGIGLEFLAPVKDTHFALGTETRLMGYPVFDDPNFFSGHLTTLEYNFIPPMFEVGYQGEKTTVLFQGGLWFGTYDLYDQGAAPNPYSDSIFENPHIQLGAKAYLFNNKMRVGAGYQQTPWGPSLYTEVGYSFGGNKP